MSCEGPPLHDDVFGHMAEWFNALVLKTSVPRGTGGSNPSVSACRGINTSTFYRCPCLIRHMNGLESGYF